MGNSRAIKLQEAVRNTMDMLYDEDYISVIKFTSKIFTEVPLMNNYQTYTSLFKIDGLRDYSSVLSIGFNGNSSFKKILLKVMEVVRPYMMVQLQELRN